MDSRLTAILVVSLLVIGVILLYLQLVMPAGVQYYIYPGSSPSYGLACPASLTKTASMLLNGSSMSVYNVSGYTDYVLNPGSSGNISFSLSYVGLAVQNASNHTIENSLVLYHAENATLINYSAGSSGQSCAGYANGTTECRGTLPTACYLADNGEFICQKQYSACTGRVYVSNTSVAADSPIYAYNYTCSESYSPPQTTRLELDTHPGLNLSLAPASETLALNKRATGTISFSALASAPQGTYILSFNGDFCGGGKTALLTVGTEPYPGAIQAPPQPLTTGKPRPR